jgi:predicted phosphoadenosine phosphosulfate sulfurtransferase
MCKEPRDVLLQGNEEIRHRVHKDMKKKWTSDEEREVEIKQIFPLFDWQSQTKLFILSPVLMPCFS